MIETLPEGRKTTELEPPPRVLAAFAAFSERLSARCALVWGEHCQECAYPSCYADCAFYTPRSDFHCRRFENGIESIASSAGLSKIAFRKWGKLEAAGPSGLMSATDAKRHDVRDLRVSQALGRPVAPLFVRRGLSARWNAWKIAEHGRGPAGPDTTFVVEGWSPDCVERAFTLTILNKAHPNDEHAGSPSLANAGPTTLFQTHFTLGAEYTRLEVPQAEIAALVELADPYLIQIEPVGEAQGITAVFGICDFVVIDPVGAAPSVGTAKVLVWDLDETLWDGVLAEDGIMGIRLKPQAAETVRALDERGVVQTISSKNDFSEAMAALQHFRLAEYFLYPEINYGPKSRSVAAQATRLGLGLDSFVFMDDQPFERAEVQAALPAVRTLAEDQLNGLLQHPWFDLPVTSESRRRRTLYEEEASRVVALETAGEDYTAFLRKSALRLDVSPLAVGDVERVFELSQRTNQLNFNGRRFSRDEVRAMADARPPCGFVMRCADRFGDYGLIGFAVVDLPSGSLDEFFMSCRVQRKRVENAFFEWLRASSIAQGAEELYAAYAPTERNRAAREMLLTLGFQEAGGRWRRNLDPVAMADVVAIAESTHREAA